MKQKPYFFASFAYGEEARLFDSAEEIEQELARLSEAEHQAKERLEQVKAAVKELNALTCSGSDAEARLRILSELSLRRRDTERLLDMLLEKHALLEEEWEDARYLLRHALCKA